MKQAQAPSEPPVASPTEAKTLRPSMLRGKSSPAPADDTAPGNITQIRNELASTQKTRGALEAKVSTLTAELSVLKTTDADQKKRIAFLENHKQQLERRMKDRADELKGKGSLVEQVQDEMVAMNLQLNMAEQEKERLQRENADLTRRWVEKMEGEAKKMNDQMGWESKRRK